MPKDRLVKNQTKLYIYEGKCSPHLLRVKIKLNLPCLPALGGGGGDPIINKCYPKLDLAIYCKFHDSAKCFPIV